MTCGNNAVKFLLSIIFIALLIVDLDIASAQFPQPIHFVVTVSDSQLASLRRDQAITNLSAGTNRFAKGDGIVQSDLDLGGLRRNITYYAIPDGGGWIYLLPYDEFAAVWSPGQADLVGGPNAQIIASFVLPQRLYLDGDTSRAYVTTQFNGTIAAWGAPEAEVNYFDPRNPTPITLDSMGKASIVLGGTFEVGATIDFGTYQGEASLTVSGDTVPRFIHFTVQVSPYFFPHGILDLELADLVPGRSYTATPDITGGLTLTPNDGIATFVTQAQTSFSADPSGNVLVSFVLPQRLYPTGGTGFRY